MLYCNKKGYLKMYRYETHLHTSPVSKCAKASVRESLEFYKSEGYDGVFLTNHFIENSAFFAEDANYEELISFFFSDYEEALSVGKEIGIKVFPGVEFSFNGNHFLVFGLTKDWYLSHPDFYKMNFKDRLNLMREDGAFVSHAHPFDERYFIDHIKLLPRSVDAVEVINVGKNDFMNSMANVYADAYGLLKTAGSDNHCGGGGKCFAGIECEDPILDVPDFISKARAGKINIFRIEREDKESPFHDVPVKFSLSLNKITE